MRWPWRRWQPTRPTNHIEPLPDGDTVLHPGDRRSADILRAVLEEATKPSPIVAQAPLITRAQRWRTSANRDAGDRATGPARPPRPMIHLTSGKLGLPRPRKARLR